MSANNLMPAAAERLALALEEMAEATQVIGKILRHGYDSYNPDGNPSITNRMDLERELGHVRFAIELLCSAGDIDRLDVIRSAARKSVSVRKWLHHPRKDVLDRTRAVFVDVFPAEDGA